MRFSNAGNNTTVFRKQKRPFEEIMQRRLIKDILINSSNELEFSKMTLIELYESSIELKKLQNDNLSCIQQEVFEELMLRKSDHQ